MQIAAWFPEGIEGLGEDVSYGYEQSSSIVHRAHTALLQAQERERTFESVYREFAPLLRKLIDAKAPETETAKGLLKRITLLQTLPFNELESPDYLDSYTGAEVSDDDEPDGKYDAIEPVPAWAYYAATRKPYLDEEMNVKFLRANMEWVGMEEEEHIPSGDDREYLPSYLQAEGQPDDDFEHCWELTQDIEDPTEFLTTMQELADEGINPGNLARIYLWKMDRLKLSPSAAETILLPHSLTKMPKGKTARWSDHNLRAWIGTYWDDLFEYMDACGSVSDDSMTNAELEQETARLFKEYLNALDDSSPNPVRQKVWVEAYIHGVLSGLPIRRIGNNYTASDAGWDAWRAATSPEGQEAYLKRLSQGASRRESMRDFYRIAYRQGVVRPSRPKTIKSIKPQGLVLSNDKFVNWSICMRIDNEEGFDLDTERRAELKAILEERGWGLRFAATL